jgi:hypothetical protein
MEMSRTLTGPIVGLLGGRERHSGVIHQWISFKKSIRSHASPSYSEKSVLPPQEHALSNRWTVLVLGVPTEKLEMNSTHTKKVWVG